MPSFTLSTFFQRIFWHGKRLTHFKAQILQSSLTAWKILELFCADFYMISRILQILHRLLNLFH